MDKKIIIDSFRNPLVKKIQAWQKDKSARNKDGVILLESSNLCREFIKNFSAEKFETLLVSEVFLKVEIQ